MLDSLKGFHIEPTNICTLKCPGCSRTQFINMFPKKWKNNQLNLDHLKKFIDIDISNKVFDLCGVLPSGLKTSQRTNLCPLPLKGSSTT